MTARRGRRGFLLLTRVIVAEGRLGRGIGGGRGAGTSGVVGRNGVVVEDVSERHGERRGRGVGARGTVGKPRQQRDKRLDREGAVTKMEGGLALSLRPNRKRPEQGRRSS